MSYNYTKHNSDLEAEALRILSEGYLPELDEAEFVQTWLPLLIKGASNDFLNVWVHNVSKNPNQQVKLMSGGVHVATVPSILAPWPTEVPKSVRGTVSEIVAESEMVSRNIPNAGVTLMRRALDQQFSKVTDLPAVREARRKHLAEWDVLLARYGHVRPNSSAAETTAAKKPADSSEGLFHDYEEL